MFERESDLRDWLSPPCILDQKSGARNSIRRTLESGVEPRLCDEELENQNHQARCWLLGVVPSLPKVGVLIVGWVRTVRLSNSSSLVFESLASFGRFEWVDIMDLVYI